jgi:isoleucyl-tRNA synthetase
MPIMRPKVSGMVILPQFLLLVSIANGQVAQMPVPMADPTPLTSAQLFRESAQLEKNMNVQLDAIRKEATEFKESLTHFPTDIDQKMTQMEKLQAQITKALETKFDEKLIGVALQFKERDVRTDQAAISTKIAVDAALQAQEKAFAAQNLNFASSLAEAKANFAKLIDNQRDLQASSAKALDDKIAVLTDLVRTSSGRSQGIGDSWMVIVGAGGLLVGFGGLIFAFTRRPYGVDRRDL